MYSIANKTDRYSCAIFTCAYYIYCLQSVFGLEQFAKVLIVPLILFAGYKYVYVVRHYKLNAFLKASAVFLLVLTIYGLAHLIFGKPGRLTSVYHGMTIPTFFFLKYIYVSFPLIFVYYDYAKKNVFNNYAISDYFQLIFIASIISFFAYYALRGSNQTMGDVTNNVGYQFVPLMAMAMLLKKNRTLFVLICYFFVVVSLKRGAVLIGTLYFLIYSWNNIKYSRQNVKGWVIVGFIFLIVAIVISFVMFYSKSEGLQLRVEQTLEGDSSGRDILLEALFKFIIGRSDIIHTIIGYGADATVRIAGNYAHNDWVELLVNQGLLGVFLFFSFYVGWLITYKKLKYKVAHRYRAIFGLLLLGSIMSSIFSMAYTAILPPTAITIGYILSCEKVKYNHN